MTYLITFRCYGTHMHGSPEGSVDLAHNHYGAPFANPNPSRLAAQLLLMDQPPYQLDEPRRQAILEAIITRCTQSDWNLLAAHVRQNHLHIIVDSQQKPEFVMTQLKSAASRRLNDLGFDYRTRKRWARHGSTRMLWNRESVQKAIVYVLDSQGDPMSTFRTATIGSGTNSNPTLSPTLPSSCVFHPPSPQKTSSNIQSRSQESPGGCLVRDPLKSSRP